MHSTTSKFGSCPKRHAIRDGIYMVAKTPRWFCLLFQTSISYTTTIKGVEYNTAGSMHPDKSMAVHYSPLIPYARVIIISFLNLIPTDKTGLFSKLILILRIGNIGCGFETGESSECLFIHEKV